jgi:hypothetical protein
MQVFIKTRAGEIMLKSDPVTEWYWVLSKYNLADMGTRSSVVVVNMPVRLVTSAAIAGWEKKRTSGTSVRALARSWRRSWGRLLGVTW